jgi:uncharacterized protein YndB with AHSA1/START domain
MHFLSPPDKVFRALSTANGRARFWAERAPEVDGVVTFHILNYEPFSGRILENVEPRIFALEYYGTKVRFELEADGQGGTDLQLLATEVDEPIRCEMIAGWVSVLMAMKAAVDHGVDLRNHDESRAWGAGYADN